MRHFLLPALFLFVFAGLTTAQPSKAGERVKIVNVTAESPVRDGVPNDFTVEIEYTLEAADEATISIQY